MLTDEQIMERNLAKLLTDPSYYSLAMSQTQPTNPFEKKLFDKKIKKSMVSLQEMYEDEKNELFKHISDVNQMFSHLRDSLNGLEKRIIGKLKTIYERGYFEKEKMVQSLLCNLEGSIQFLMHADELSVKDTNLEQNELTQRVNNLMKRNSSLANMREQVSTFDNRPTYDLKENRRASCNRIKSGEKDSKRRKKQERQTKSIYQSVLEEREKKCKKNKKQGLEKK